MDNIINNLKDSFSCINENKYIIGLTMICLNIGARFIIDELDDDLRSKITINILENLLFAVFFLATKGLYVSCINYYFYYLY